MGIWATKDTKVLRDTEADEGQISYFVAQGPSSQSGADDLSLLTPLRSHTHTPAQLSHYHLLPGWASALFSVPPLDLAHLLFVYYQSLFISLCVALTHNTLMKDVPYLS